MFFKKRAKPDTYTIHPRPNIHLWCILQHLRVIVHHSGQFEKPFRQAKISMNKSHLPYFLENKPRLFQTHTIFGHAYFRVMLIFKKVKIA